MQEYVGDFRLPSSRLCKADGWDGDKGPNFRAWRLSMALHNTLNHRGWTHGFDEQCWMRPVWVAPGASVTALAVNDNTDLTPTQMTTTTSFATASRKMAILWISEYGWSSVLPTSSGSV